MIRRAARLEYEFAEEAADDTGNDAVPWEEYLAACRKEPNRRMWTGNLPQAPDRDYSEFGADADMMRRVAGVVEAVLREPPPNEPHEV